MAIKFLTNLKRMALARKAVTTGVHYPRVADYEQDAVLYIWPSPRGPDFVGLGHITQ